MKKILLFAFVACAMSANAQKVVNLNNVQSANLVQMTANNSFKAAVAAQASTASVAAAPAQKVAVCEGQDSSHSLFGKYIEIFPEGDIVVGNNVLAESEIDPETGDQLVKFNATFKGWGQEVYGIYDEAAKTVTIPAEQYVGTADYNGMELYLFAFQALPSEEEGKLNLGGDWDEETGDLIAWHDLVYDVKTDDAGTIYLELQEGGWCLLATDGLDEDAQTLGVWTSDLEGHMLNKANWTAHYWACYVGANGWGEWEEKHDDVYVELFDDGMMVNGFDGQFVFEMGLDGAAGVCTLPNQDVFYYAPYDRMYSVWGVDGQSITNYYDFAMTGVYNADKEYVALYDMETQKGKQFYICTQYEEGVGAYMMGTFDGLELWSMCGPIGSDDGIDTVLAPNTKKAIYNLAGQRSNTYVKGINIEAGKKVVR